MFNAYQCKYVAVKLIDGQQRVSKEGTMNVVAASQQDAGAFAQGYLKAPDTVEVNIHLVHEIAKDVKVLPEPFAYDVRPTESTIGDLSKHRAIASVATTAPEAKGKAK